MRTAETELEMVRRHTKEGAEHLTKQRALIARLRDAGFSSAVAEALLVNFEHSQRRHEDHLARIMSKQG